MIVRLSVMLLLLGVKLKILKANHNATEYLKRWNAVVVAGCKVKNSESKSQLIYRVQKIYICCCCWV